MVFIRFLHWIFCLLVLEQKMNVSASNVVPVTLRNLNHKIRYGISIRAVSLTKMGPISKLLEGQPHNDGKRVFHQASCRFSVAFIFEWWDKKKSSVFLSYCKSQGNYLGCSIRWYGTPRNVYKYGSILRSDYNHSFKILNYLCPKMHL